MKNLEYIIKKTTIDTGYPEDQVRIVLHNYWKTVFKDIQKMESTTIALRNIGVFTVSRYKLAIFIRNTIWKIKNMRKSSKWGNEVKEDYIEKHKDKLKRSLVHRNKIAINYAKNFGNI